MYDLYEVSLRSAYLLGFLLVQTFKGDEIYMLERQIEKFLTDNVKKIGGLSVKLNSSSFSGLPDRMILMQKGRVYFVELKAPGKKPRPLQTLVHKTLNDLGFKVYVIDTKEKVGEFINAIQTT